MVVFKTIEIDGDADCITWQIKAKEALTLALKLVCAYVKW